jgi:UDP-glucuronate 4-epimerase
MRILVTGAAGFIGFHLTERLLREGHDVVGVDSLSASYRVRLKEDRLALLTRNERAPRYFRFIRADVCDFAAMKTLTDETAPECVVHLAAQPGVRSSVTHPFECQKNNVEGFLSVLECCRQAARTPRLVYASSSSVYGGNTELPYSEDQNVDRPVSLYAATKKANELMAHTYAHLYGIQTIGLRFFTVYGPWYRPDMALYLFADAMTQGRPLRVFNRGELRRDFTYVDDIVEGTLRCILGAGFERCEVLNIGNNKPERLLDVIGLLAAELNVRPELEFLPMQQGDVLETWASTDRLAAKTGYAPATSLREGIKRFAAWYTAYTRA